VGAVSPPVGSDLRVAILCPHRQPLGAGLGEHPIGLGDRAIGVEQTVTIGSLGTRLEGLPAQWAGLSQVQQQGGTVATDHLGVLDQQGGEALGIAHESGEAGGGDDGKHRSRGRGVVEVCPPRLNLSYSIWSPRQGLKG